jgi:transcriptional regulator with XRE-family HTH domain
MKETTKVNNFGKRLAKLRKAKGLTQKGLGEKIGVSRRIIVYYEVESDYPPAHLIIPLAKALNLTTDELLGIKETKEVVDVRLSAFWRKLKVVETFSDKDKKTVLQFVNVIAEKNKAQEKQTNQ